MGYTSVGSSKFLYVNCGAHASSSHTILCQRDIPGTIRRLRADRFMEIEDD